MVRRATTPILLVRPREKALDLAAEPVLRHVLIPLDGSGLAEQVLETAVALGRLMQSEYTLLRIYGPEIGGDETKERPASFQELEYVG